MSPGGKNSALAGLVRMLAWGAVLLGVAIVLDMVGPWQGWTLRLRDTVHGTSRGSEDGQRPRGGHDSLFTAREDRIPSIQRPRDRSGHDAGDTPGAGDSLTLAGDSNTPGSVATRPPDEKTPLEEEFQEIYEEVLAILPKPEKDRVYTIRTRDQQELRGQLLDIRPGRLFVRTKYGTLAIPISALHPREVKRFFPSREARNRALEILAFRERRRAEAAAAAQPAESDDSPEIASVSPPPSEPEAAVSLVVTPPMRGNGGPVEFNPSPAKSDPSLLPLVRNFAGWLEVQHRRVGGKIADKAYARRQNGAAILYLVMHPQFLAQEYETQFQFAESLWQFWAFRARDFGAVSAPERAYIVFLDPHQEIIGGSRPDSGGNVWMKGGRSTVTAQR